MTFRYAACGGANTLFDIFLFFISYNFVFDKQIVRLPFISISPYIAAFMLSFCITFPIGFLLNRYVVFQGSVIAGRIQFFRYGVTVVVSLLLNYLFLKLFVEWLGLFPTVAKILRHRL
jgi:putative flippase GtrA